jgi:hypothetical protein
LNVVGYPFNKKNIKDGALIAEVIKAYLLKNYDIPHPFHDLAENLFSLDVEENLTMTGNLSIMTDTLKAVGNN